MLNTSKASFPPLLFSFHHHHKKGRLASAVFMELDFPAVKLEAMEGELLSITQIPIQQNRPVSGLPNTPS